MPLVNFLFVEEVMEQSPHARTGHPPVEAGEEKSALEGKRRFPGRAVQSFIKGEGTVAVIPPGARLTVTPAAAGKSKGDGEAKAKRFTELRKSA
jgi:hypothetical protein